MASPVRFPVVRKILEAAGYELVRVRGSHHIFEKAGEPLVVIPVHRKLVKSFYVQWIKKNIAGD